MRAFFCALFLSAAPVSAADPGWVVLDRVSYLSLKGWEELTGFHPFVQEGKGRILLERRGRSPLILLLDSPYALQGGKFLSLPHAPIARGGEILLSRETAERVFLPVLSTGDRAVLQKLLDEPSAKAAGRCRHRRVERVFLDPGHGGEDFGTTVDGIREKDIVLNFARLAADELRRRGFRVSFSRTRDVFLPLEIRPKLAKEWNASVFVSIHVNSSPSASAQGTETYILSQDATDAEARKLALLENSIAGKAEGQASAVQDILWDMEQTAYLQDSAYMASYVQKAIVRHARDLFQRKKMEGDWRNRGVRQAPFYVLNRAPMPAILVEIGYLSHPQDRRLMGEKFFQESLAKALAEGVKKYKEVCRRGP